MENIYFLSATITFQDIEKGGESNEKVHWRNHFGGDGRYMFRVWHCRLTCGKEMTMYVL